MDTTDEQRQADWWAEGDTPVRSDSRVTYLVDGHMAMLTMCKHFLKARQYIHLANWGITPRMELVRGTDHKAGPDGSAEEEQLLAELRAAGLDKADIDFWRTHSLSLRETLGYGVRKGVEVKALLWDSVSLPYLSHYQPAEAKKELEEVGVTCLLDDSARGILHHPVESLHQKISIVDGIYAFVGGVDPLIESEGEFDRWDTHAHFFSTPLRRTTEGTTPHPWHDAHALIEGPLAGDVELNFRQRWNDVVSKHHLDDTLLVRDESVAQQEQTQPTTVTGAGQTLAQVARTIPEHTYKFGPKDGIQGIAQLYAKALANAQQFIYLENQYFWLRAYTGVDVPLLGYDSPQMEYNIRKMGEALQRGASMAIVLPDHPNVGRAFTDAGLTTLYEKAPEALEQGRLHTFCLATSIQQEDGEHYRPIYVHAKVGIIDDIWATVGSGNLNNRGMRDDTEMNVATLNRKLAVGLRLMLWAEHLGLVRENDLLILARYLGQRFQAADEQSRAAQLWQYLQEKVGDPQSGMRLLVECAQENLKRYKARQPLVGHLLPYLKAEEATQQGLNFREEHGWIEEP